MSARAHPSAASEAWRRTDPHTFSFAGSGEFSFDWLPDGTDLPTGLILSRTSVTPGAIPPELRELPREAFSDYLIDEGSPFVTLRVEPGVRISTPVRLKSVLPEGGSRLMARLIILEEGADISIHDEMRDAGGDQALIWEGVVLKPDACLSIHRSLGPVSPWFIQSQSFLGRYSLLRRLTSVETASTLKSHQETILAGEGAETHDHLIDRVTGSGRVDALIHVDHLAPHAVSRVEGRGVVDDRGYSLHHGLMTLRRSCAGADSYFSSRHILLSKGARCGAIPKLKIETDEVKAGHGATVGALDPDAIYYLMARGLTREEARSTLIKAFLTPPRGLFPEESTDVA